MLRNSLILVAIMLIASSATAAGVDLSGEYWFGSLSADADTFVPWGKQGKVVITGNNWNQQWDANDGHHTFSSTFTTTIQPDGSININLSSGIYNVAWNGNAMIHADAIPDANNRLGIDIMVRKAANAEVNDVIGDYTFFGHWLNWTKRADSDGWGDLVVDANGTAFVTSVEDDGHHEDWTMQWSFDDVNAVIIVPEKPPYSLCANGLIGMSHPQPDVDFGYNFFVRKTNRVITPDDIAGTYLVRFLESNKYGQPFTCGRGTCIVRADGTFSVDAYYTDGEHDIFDANYTIGSGNTFTVTGTLVQEGIISPELGLIFLPEYDRPQPPGPDDWIGGIFLIRVSNNIADLNGDKCVNLKDYAIFAQQWLKSSSDLSADFNPDGQVNWSDLKIFADNWLQDTDFGDPFIGTRTMTLYGDDNISDGVTIEPNEVTAVISTNNNDNYKIEMLGTTFSMTRDGNDLLVLNPQPQYFDTWILPNVYMLSDGSNGAFLLMGKDPNPLDISIHVATWAPPVAVLGSQLAGQWQMKWVFDDNLRDAYLSPFTVETGTFSITDLGGGQVSVQFGETNWLMNINGNKLEPVEPIDPAIVYFSMVTDGQGITITLIGVETYDPTDVSARIGLASRVP
jgi:hypothetical protein